MMYNLYKYYYIPSYNDNGSKLCLHDLIKFLIKIGVYAMTAAAVLDVGNDEQSPKAHIFVYLTCYNVLGCTLT